MGVSSKDLSIVAFAALLALGACDRGKAGQEQAKPAPAAGIASPTAAGGEQGTLDRGHAGLKLPALPFSAPGGGAATFGGFRGKPVLVNLWATWCGPCVKELPTLDALARRDAGKLGVVAVSEDSGGDKQVGPFWKARGFATLVPYTDPRMALMTALQADVLPTTILFDASGKEVWRVTGGKDWTGAEAAKLLGER